MRVEGTALVVEDATDRHAGNYTCFASNLAGNTSVSLQLVVTGEGWRLSRGGGGVWWWGRVWWSTGWWGGVWWSTEWWGGVWWSTGWVREVGMVKHTLCIPITNFLS